MIRNVTFFVSTSKFWRHSVSWKSCYKWKVSYRVSWEMVIKNEAKTETNPKFLPTCNFVLEMQIGLSALYLRETTSSLLHLYQNELEFCHGINWKLKCSVNASCIFGNLASDHLLCWFWFLKVPPVFDLCLMKSWYIFYSFLRLFSE